MPSQVHTIMTADENGEELVSFAKATAERLVKDGLSRNQIRNIFTEVRQIEAMWFSNETEAMRRLNMVKPKLSYQSARHRQVKYLENTLSEAIDEVNRASSQEEQGARFQRFVNLFEAILAYHRAQGGRN